MTRAFARVLAEHGYAGATVAAVAAEAEVSPGLIHHHFRDKQDLMSALLETLRRGFRQRVERYRREQGETPMGAYIDGALRLDASADTVAARCWVGLFAEAVRDPVLFRRVRRLIDAEIQAIRRRAGGTLDTRQAGAVLAYVVGALVVGAFAPRKAAGFAAPGLRMLVAAMTGEQP